MQIVETVSVRNEFILPIGFSCSTRNFFLAMRIQKYKKWREFVYMNLQENKVSVPAKHLACNHFHRIAFVDGDIDKGNGNSAKHFLNGLPEHIKQNVLGGK